MSKLLRMVILGAPGSGKGTISSRIVRDFGVTHLSSGDLLRSQIIKKSDVGLAAQKYMNAGKLVPDEVMVNLISSELRGMSTVSWLLDGFPRTRPQAEALHSQHKLDLVLSLEVPDQVIIDRIKCRWIHAPSGRVYNDEFNPPEVPGKDDVTGEDLVQRDDDKPEAVKKRLILYNENTAPLKEFYMDLGILYQFHGKETNVIWPSMRNFLCHYMPAKQGA